MESSRLHAECRGDRPSHSRLIAVITQLRSRGRSDARRALGGARVFETQCVRLLGQVPALLLLSVFGPLAVSAAVVSIQLPAETNAFNPGPGSELANGQCLVCHSVEYVATQPPMPQTFWAAEVKKMRDKYGAVLPEGQVQPLVSYLTRVYGVGTNSAPEPAQIPVSAPLPAGEASAPTGEAIATKYGCLGCHGASAKIVGPAYKDIAAKYSQDPQASARVSEQIHKGGSGKWGSIIMPPFPTVSDAETKALSQWILSRK
jgi:cytochrome c551/c552